MKRVFTTAFLFISFTVRNGVKERAKGKTFYISLIKNLAILWTLSAGFTFQLPRNEVYCDFDGAEC